LNFSDWSRYDKSTQAENLRLIQETVKTDMMPMPSYLLAHSEAKLSPEDKIIIGNWAKAERQRIINGISRNQALQ
jgi:hypothetical protein